MKLHEKIRFLRALQGFSQQEMAEKLNLSPNAYSKVEQGRTDITPDRLQKIADILDMKVEDIKSIEEEIVFNNIENGTNTNFGNFNLAENFEKEREAYKLHINSLEKQIQNQIQMINQLMGQMNK